VPCASSLWDLLGYLEQEHGPKVLELDCSRVETVHPGSKRTTGLDVGGEMPGGPDRGGMAGVLRLPMEPQNERQKGLMFGRRRAEK